MKKLLALIMAIALMLPASGLADFDLTTMLDLSKLSDHALKQIISMCSAELRSRAMVDEKGILLFEYEGIAMYQTGDAEINASGFIIVPVYIENNRDEPTCIAPESVKCNGLDIMANFGGTIQANAKTNANMIFLSADAKLKTLDDVISLSFKWTVFSGITFKTLYEDETDEEHRFW